MASLFGRRVLLQAEKFEEAVHASLSSRREAENTRKLNDRMDATNRTSEFISRYIGQ
jgi:hypothetical protein